MQTDTIGSVPADAHDGVGHLELPTFVGAFEGRPVVPTLRLPGDGADPTVATIPWTMRG